MYDNGEGVPENDAEAVKWWRLAAEQGHANAQARLSYMYYAGDGIPKNKIKAYIWASLAVSQGEEEARENRDILAKQLTRKQLARGQEMAARCYESGYKDCD